MKIVLTITLLAISVSTFGQTVRGIIIDGTRNEIISFASITLLTLDKNIVRTTTSDDSGKFMLTDLPLGRFLLKVGYIPYGDTVFPVIKVSNDSTLRLDIHKPCKYDFTLNDNTCPTCHKRDEVIPIIYGELVITKATGQNNDKSTGKTSYEPYIDFYPGGCLVGYCEPGWYCKRDKTKY